MLNLSNADLAHLRLECLKLVMSSPMDTLEESYAAADHFVAWCLRERVVAWGEEQP